MSLPQTNSITIPNIDNLSVWDSIRTIIHSITRTFVRVSVATEKTVKVVENEVDNIEEMQQIRLDKVKQERKEALKLIA